MDVKQKQQKAANITVATLAVIALLIYIGFYFLVLNQWNLKIKNLQYIEHKVEKYSLKTIDLEVTSQ